jgi:hypothetical protein
MVGGHPSAWNVTITGPDKGEEIKRGGPPEEHVQSGGSEQSTGKQATRREPLRKLAVDQLPDAIGDLQRHQHGAEIRLRVPELGLQAGQRNAEIIPAKVKRSVSEPEDPEDETLPGRRMRRQI